MKFKITNIIYILVISFVCSFINIKAVNAWENVCEYGTVNIYFNETSIRFEYSSTGLTDRTEVDTSKNITASEIWYYYDFQENYKCPDYIYRYYPCKNGTGANQCASNGYRFYTFKSMPCASDLTCRRRDEKLVKSTLNDPDLSERIKDSSSKVPEAPQIDDCQSLLGSPDDSGVNGKGASPAYYLSVAFKVIKYIAIIVLIVFTMLDMVNSLASHDNDLIKKSLKNALTRLILCFIIFALPIFIDLILKIIDDKSISTCINMRNV